MKHSRFDWNPLEEVGPEYALILDFNSEDNEPPIGAKSKYRYPMMRVFSAIDAIGDTDEERVLLKKARCLATLIQESRRLEHYLPKIEEECSRLAFHIALTATVFTHTLSAVIQATQKATGSNTIKLSVSQISSLRDRLPVDPMTRKLLISQLLGSWKLVQEETFEDDGLKSHMDILGVSQQQLDIWVNKAKEIWETRKKNSET